jgi:tetratricopeptide (TPR) repeat protein
MRVAPTILLMVVLGASASLAAQTREENWTQCKADDPDLSIAGCTKIIQAANETDVDMSNAFDNRGASYAQKKDYDRAIQDFDQAIRLNPVNAQAFRNRGATYRYKKDNDRAIQDYDQAIRLNSNDADAFRRRGAAYHDKKDYDRAIQDYDQAIRLSPNDALSFRDRCLTFYFKNDNDRAIHDCDQAIRLNPNDTVSLLYRALVYEDKSDYGRAIQDLNEAIRLDPHYAAAFRNRGHAYTQMKDYDRALQDLDQAILLNGSDPLAFDYRGTVFGDKKDYDRSIQDLNEAIRLDPNYGLAFRNRGIVYRDKNDYDRAIENCGQAIRLDSSDVSAFICRAGAYEDKKDYDRSIQDLNEAIRLNPNDGDGFRSRADEYKAKLDYVRAIQDYDEAIRLNPSDAVAFNFRGRTRFLQGQFAAAESDLLQALKLDPNSTFAALWLYLARSKSGQDGRNELVQNSAQMKLTGWPGVLVSLYLGKATPAAVLSVAGDPDPETDRIQHCWAYFFLGEYALMKGNAAEAKRLFQQTVDTGASYLGEYASAQSELKRLLPASPAPTRGPQPPGSTIAGGGLQAGKYYALVIGINRYPDPLPKLETAVADAREVAKVLQNQYGFEVKTLLDDQATRANILDAIYQYRVKLKPEENNNLLIYYAGHGFSDKDADKAYWLPVDADSAYSSYRISADDLTSGVKVQSARHVLIISDSCYSGDLSRDLGMVSDPAVDREAYLRYLGKMLGSRSRTIMASGGDEPVSDGGKDGHSVFAYALLQSLEHADQDMFTATDLFDFHLRQRVGGNSDQQPRYDIIRNSGHDEGDFVFVQTVAGGK